ncbi:MAG: hypothetical protein KGH72_03720 [Candidatus Micrarchaeota archaeon]|nr:hypothetical protein [Candidatus Micrarchaeota archaeon]
MAIVMRPKTARGRVIALLQDITFESDEKVIAFLDELRMTLRTSNAFIRAYSGYPDALERLLTDTNKRMSRQRSEIGRKGIVEYRAALRDAELDGLVEALRGVPEWPGSPRFIGSKVALDVAYAMDAAAKIIRESRIYDPEGKELVGILRQLPNGNGSAAASNGSRNGRSAD